MPNTVLEWAAEAVVEDADGTYGGFHNFWIYDQGTAGYVWLVDHTDSALEWLEVFTPSLGYKEHPIYWWAGRALPDPPAKNYLLVINDPTARAQYVNAIGTQVAKWNASEIVGWIDTWSQQIAGAVAQDPHKWATMDQFWMAITAMKDMAQNRPQYLNNFLACENGDPSQATDQDGDGVRLVQRLRRLESVGLPRRAGGLRQPRGRQLQRRRGRKLSRRDPWLPWAAGRGRTADRHSPGCGHDNGRRRHIGVRGHVTSVGRPTRPGTANRK